MNICDYIRDNDLTFKMVDGNMHQVETLYLGDKNITSLDGFVQNGDLDLSNNQITSLDGFVQNGQLDLRYNNITSLKGFVQNGYLNLRYNQITSLDGFVQNGFLSLSDNLIKSLDGFTQNSDLDLRHNKITSLKDFVQNNIVYLAHYWHFDKMEDGSLNIGCVNKSIEEWNTFFDNGDEIQLKNDSEEYLEIKKYFKMLYINN